MTSTVDLSKINAQQSDTQVLDQARNTIDIEIEALQDLKNQLDHNFIQALQLIEKSKGRVIITGMGKSGLVGKKIAATLSSTGTPALFLHPAEGSHGDLGAIMAEDIVIGISNSGETPEILGVLPLVKRFGIPLIAMTGKINSTLAKRSDAILNIAVKKEACPMGLAPTASTTATLALGDALAVALIERKGFTAEDFALFHPAGALGKRLLLKVEDVMHTKDAIPTVSEDTPFIDALTEINTKRLGFTLVLNGKQNVLGILTDGDVRRALSQELDLKTTPIKSIMTESPKTINPDALAVSALREMEAHKIMMLIITAADGSPEGVVHMHDILKTGIT